MKIKKVTVNEEIFQHAMACFLAFAAHLEDKYLDAKVPTLDSIMLGTHLIFSALKNSGEFDQETIAKEFELLAVCFRGVEGPKR
jgi:hypothetical protein